MNEAFDLIEALALELQIDYELEKPVVRRLELIAALAKHRVDIRSTQDEEMMNDFQARLAQEAMEE